MLPCQGHCGRNSDAVPVSRMPAVLGAAYTGVVRGRVGAWALRVRVYVRLTVY